MRIIAFVYDFPHQKSSEGLLALKIHGCEVLCVAAPKRILNIRPSPLRITPILEPPHPRDVAKALGFDYLVYDHDSPKLLEHINGHEWAVILGARILKPFLVNNLSIINMHPGLLPINRGLDNIKWAIIKEIPQAVTTHVIDEKIDVGWLIERRFVDIYQDDSLIDVFLRVKNLEIQMMINAIKLLPYLSLKKLERGIYHSTLPDELDDELSVRFKEYKSNYKNIVSYYESFSSRIDLEQGRAYQASL